MKSRYFECKNCGQVVQGFIASQTIECCNHPDYEEIPGPDAATREVFEYAQSKGMTMREYYGGFEDAD